MKLTIKDIELKSRFTQISDAIEAKYDSTEARGTIEKADQQRLMEYVKTISENIDDYKEHKDIVLLEKILILSLDYDIDECIAKSYMNIGFYFSFRNDHVASLRFFYEALHYSKKDIDLLYTIKIEIINAHSNLLEYERAETSATSYEFLYPIKNASQSIRFRYYYTMVVLYVNCNKNRNARTMLKKALENAQSDYEKCQIYTYVGICDKRQRKYESAMKYFKDALALAASDKDLAICYSNLAGLYHTKKQRELAEENINMAMKYANPEDANTYVTVYMTYAQIYNTQDCILELLDRVDKVCANLLIKNVLDALNMVVDKIEDKSKLKAVLFKLIGENEHYRPLKFALYAVLGRMAYLIEKKRYLEEA